MDLWLESYETTVRPRPTRIQKLSQCYHRESFQGYQNRERVHGKSAEDCHRVKVKVCDLLELFINHQSSISVCCASGYCPDQSSR